MQSLVEDLLDLVNSPDFIAIAVLCLLLGARSTRPPWETFVCWAGDSGIVAELTR